MPYTDFKTLSDNMIKAQTGITIVFGMTKVEEQNEATSKNSSSLMYPESRDIEGH